MQKVIKNFKLFSIWPILTLGLIFRLILINQSFWLDEASQAMTSLRSVNDILFNNLADFHPPFMYLLTHFWIMISRSEIWLRLLPVGFGVVSIYVGYLLAVKLFSKNVGLLFGLLLALSPYHIYYSQEFRMYSLVTLLVLLSMYFFVQIIEGSKSRMFQTGFIVSSALILYTHYLAGSIFLVQALYVFIYHRSYVWKYIQSLLLVGLLFVPWIPQLFAQLSVGVAADTYLPGWSQMLSLSFYKAIPLLFIKFIIGRIDFNNILIYLAVIFSAVAATLVCLYPIIKQRQNKLVVLVLFWLIIPILFTFVISFKLPMFQPFRLLFCLPALMFLLAIGIDSYKKSKTIVLTTIILVFLICQSIFWLGTTFWREDWRAAVSSSNMFVQDQGAVLFAWTEPFPPFLFYSPVKNGLGVIKTNPGSKAEVDYVLSTQSLGSKIVVFNYLSQLTDPNNEIKSWLLVHNYRLVETRDFNGVGTVDYYIYGDQLIGFSVH